MVLIKISSPTVLPNGQHWYTLLRAVFFVVSVRYWKLLGGRSTVYNHRAEPNYNRRSRRAIQVHRSHRWNTHKSVYINAIVILLIIEALKPSYSLRPRDIYLSDEAAPGIGSAVNRTTKVAVGNWCSFNNAILSSPPTSLLCSTSSATLPRSPGLETFSVDSPIGRAAERLV